MWQFSIIFFVLSICLLPVLPAPLPSDQALGKRGGTQYGRGTWFYDGLGACGYTNVNSDPIVALSVDIYDSGAYCNQWVTITNTANGKTAYGMVRDECMGCGATDLDMSTGLFQQLGNLATGVLSISWDFMPAGSSP